MRRHLGLLVALVTAFVGLPATTGTAQDALPVRPTTSHIDPALDGVAVTSPEYDELAAEYEAARDGRESAERRVAELQVEQRRQTAVVREAEQAVVRARRRLAGDRRELRSMAVSAYIGIEGAEPVELGAAIGDDSVHLDDARVVVAEILGEDRVARVEASRARLRGARTALTEAEAELAATRGALVEVEAQRDGYLERELTLGPDVTDARAVARVAGHDLPLVALDAYVVAARRQAETDPGCGLGWELLAGIGRVESRHGSYGGTRLTPDGWTEDEIIGIALTGGGGTAFIGDTDGGELDRDTTYDRAVGPMQFIPSTWARWAQDGDDDDEADPHNLYDAARTAAAYLCAAGPGLDGPAGVERAVLSYNRSRSYLAQVARLADDYRDLLP